MAALPPTSPPSLVDLLQQWRRGENLHLLRTPVSHTPPVEEKGIGRRLIDCISEFGAIIRDIGIAIFHFLTCGCFRREASSAPPVSTSAVTLTARQSFQFFAKRNHLMTLVESPRAFDEFFFQLYREYPQAEQREFLVKDYAMYTLKKVSLGLTQGTSSEDTSSIVDIAESLRNEREPRLTSRYDGFARQLYKAIKQGSTTAYSEVIRLARVYWEVKSLSS